MMVKIVADSISPQGIRLTTFHLRYWRAIHAELMTHRDFSRNARSSRAVPSRVLLTEPIFVPQFGMNKPGMQSDILASPDLQEKWGREWQSLAQICRDFVEGWQKEGMHKQHANRPLEWFGWIDVLVSATRWGNFWVLRISEYAQPEFNELALAMREAMLNSTPRHLYHGQWHLPYITNEEQASLDIEQAKILSTARCARLSYEPFDGEADYDREFARYEKLVLSQPVHASPAEHQATPDMVYPEANLARHETFRNPHLHGNFHGWIQNRKLIPNEYVVE